MSGVEVLVRQQDNEKVLLVYRLDGRAPTAQQCEDVGEDHGFYEPHAEAAHSFGAYAKAQLVREGFQGGLCDHAWKSWGHYGRNPFGQFSACSKCGVSAMTVHRKRSPQVSYLYDKWELREHVWRLWLQRGPVLGSLVELPHHQKGGAQ
ncbi:hypothetical protein [uncultured Deinococcus sp.]|uniref:hypothetical protein n=1 Tax=uncultured Deinococcus sp. TaxID=158789 RepID=UPI0025885C2B|nr:hypothetical protein [uncultured Deinococcus sp.]